MGGGGGGILKLQKGFMNSVGTPRLNSKKKQPEILQKYMHLHR